MGFNKERKKHRMVVILLLLNRISGDDGDGRAHFTSLQLRGIVFQGRVR